MFKGGGAAMRAVSHSRDLVCREVPQHADQGVRKCVEVDVEFALCDEYSRLAGPLE